MNEAKVNTEIGDVILPSKKNVPLPQQIPSTAPVDDLDTLPGYIVDLSRVNRGSLHPWRGNAVAFRDDLVLYAPLYARQSTLGFGGSVWIDFEDSTGFRITTHSVETILQLADYFGERDRLSFLGAAAIHYGFDDAWTLIRGRHE